MARFRLRATRYPDVLAAIERQLAPDGSLTCSLGAGRVHLVLRGVWATRWGAESQLGRALEMAAAARAVLAADARAPVRVHAHHAVVVRYEDAAVVAGCQLRTVWECVVPSTAT